MSDTPSLWIATQLLLASLASMRYAYCPAGFIFASNRCARTNEPEFGLVTFPSTVSASWFIVQAVCPFPCRPNVSQLKFVRLFEYTPNCDDVDGVISSSVFPVLKENSRMCGPLSSLTYTLL